MEPAPRVPTGSGDSWFGRARRPHAGTAPVTRAPRVSLSRGEDIEPNHKGENGRCERGEETGADPGRVVSALSETAARGGAGSAVPRRQALHVYGTCGDAGMERNLHPLREGRRRHVEDAVAGLNAPMFMPPQGFPGPQASLHNAARACRHHGAGRPSFLACPFRADTLDIIEEATPGGPCISSAIRTSW